MKKFKSILSLLLAGVMLCSALVGCGSENAGTGSSGTGGDSSQVEEIPEKYEHLSANGITTWDNGYMRKDLTSLELTYLMGNGINLGNTMEACDNNVGNVSDDPGYYEKLWGAPITTQEMITGMKEAGFDTLRIPVAWMTNATDLAYGEYKISEAYLDRVEEIINYALNEDMYVIVNDHWDGGWYGMFGSEDPAMRELAMEAYISMWTQIAERYKEYSDYLIFEGANEEIGARFDENSPIYALDSTDTYMDKDECYELANKVNQAFVDAVRATGGNNEYRFLLVPGYGTNIGETCDERFIMPTDTAKSKLLISVHYYDPSGYTIFASLPTWGTKDEHKDMWMGLEEMLKFTKEGYGVVIGECGAIFLVDGQLKDGACEWTSFFLDNCDANGFCPILWDTNSSFDRNAAKFKFDDLAQIFLDHSFEAQSSMTEDELKKAASTAVGNTYASITEEVVVYVQDNEAKAWIMFTANDWAIQYSVGDTYTPTAATAGLVANDVLITGEGTYTVSLDFTGVDGGYASSTAFSAVGIANGEMLFPGYYIENVEVKINGQVYELKGDYYTTSDDKLCTRVNLFNEWVTKIPDEARRADGNLANATPCLLDKEDAALAQIKTIEVTFDYVAPAA